MALYPGLVASRLEFGFGCLYCCGEDLLGLSLNRSPCSQDEYRLRTDCQDGAAE